VCVMQVPAKGAAKVTCFAKEAVAVSDSTAPTLRTV